MSHHRAFLLAASAILYPLILAGFELIERPGLGIGIGHFYYFPVAMVALAMGPAWGAAAGVAATGFYTLGIVLNPRLPPSDVLTAGDLPCDLTALAIPAPLKGQSGSQRPPAARRRRAPADSPRSRQAPVKSAR